MTTVDTANPMPDPDEYYAKRLDYVVKLLAEKDTEIARYREALELIAEKDTFIKNYSRSHTNPYGEEVLNPFCELARDALAGKKVGPNG